MLFHGTKVLPTRILLEGLKPIDIQQAVNMVIEKYCIPDYLRHIFNNRIQDYIRRKNNHLFVYLTDNIREAISYARYGSNFCSLLEIEACDLIGTIWKPTEVGYLYFVALEGKGEVKLPFVHPRLIVGWSKLL